MSYDTMHLEAHSLSVGQAACQADRSGFGVRVTRAIAKVTCPDCLKARRETDYQEIASLENERAAMADRLEQLAKRKKVVHLERLPYLTKGRPCCGVQVKDGDEIETAMKPEDATCIPCVGVRRRQAFETQTDGARMVKKCEARLEELSK